MELKEYRNYLIDYIDQKLITTKTKGIVLGISGGIDSSVCSGLVKLATKNNYLCVAIFCDSSPLDYTAINELVYKFRLNFLNIDITEQYHNIVKKLEDKLNKPLDHKSKGNIIARLRMTTLYAIANEKNYLVCATDNASELYTGYFTKHGDGAGDIFPLSKLLKKHIYEIARDFKIPDIIIERKPTASLYNGQTDEEEMGVSYQEIDDFLEGKKISETAKNKIIILYNNSKHKRGKADVPKDFIKLL